jgi:hypothetical protein
LERSNGWRNLVGALVAGIGHDLNGHITALKGIAHVARTGPGLDAEMLDLLDEQVARLEEAIRLLRGLPLVRDDRVELTSLKDVIEGVTRLWSRRSGAMQARVRVVTDGHSPVVLIRRRALAAGLLLLLDAAESSGGSAGGVELRFGEDGEGGGWVRIESTGAATQEGDSHEDVEAEAAQWIEHAGAHLEVTGAQGSVRFEVRIPFATEEASGKAAAATAF